MMGRTNGGSGVSLKDYAISVTFPAGSECTCTNGTKVLKSKGTQAGAWIFPVAVGDWTVTISRDGASAQKTVSITTENKSVHLGMGYALYAIQNGAFQNGITWTANVGQITQGDISTGTPAVCFDDRGQTGDPANFQSSEITVPDYVSTLHFVYPSYSSYYGVTLSFLGASMYVPGGAISQPKTVTLDVSALRGQTGRLRISYTVVWSGEYTKSYISDIWFD